MTKKNKVKFGLKNVHYAKMTETVTEDGRIQYSYDTPKAWPGAVSMALDAQGETENFYADDGVYVTTSTNNGYEGDYESALVPEDVKTGILNEKADDNGVLIETNDVVPEYFALLFEFSGDAKARRHVLYRCILTRPSIESNTKEDTTTPQTETVQITASPRADGRVKATTPDSMDDKNQVYTDWYKKVYEPAFAEEE